MIYKQPRFYIPVAIVALLLAFWLWPSSSEVEMLTATARIGSFKNIVVSSGELMAENAEKIKGPDGLQRYRIYDIKIEDIIPEGTMVKKGDYIAALDRSELNNRMNDTQLDLEKAEGQNLQVQLDTALSLRDARENIRNLMDNYEQNKLILEQSKYEPPATIKQAELALAKSKRAVEEAKENYKLKKNQAVARMQEANSNLQKSRNQLESLITLQNQFTISAPASGMFIYEREWGGSKIKAGSQISTWDPVVGTLPDLRSMQSKTFINEVDISKVRIGQSVNISLDAYPAGQLKGEVLEVANMGEKRKNDDSKVFEVIVKVTESDSTYRPGMTTSNQIVTNELDSALLIPIEAVFGDDDHRWVYVKDGSIKKREVQVDVSNDIEIVVLKGLKEGEVVLLNEPASAKSMKLIPLE
jgi:RND family efflux transporter MFP subunit